MILFIFCTPKSIKTGHIRFFFLIYMLITGDKYVLSGYIGDLRLLRPRERGRGKHLGVCVWQWWPADDSGVDYGDTQCQWCSQCKWLMIKTFSGWVTADIISLDVWNFFQLIHEQTFPTFWEWIQRYCFSLFAYGSYLLYYNICMIISVDKCSRSKLYWINCWVHF